MCNSCRSALHSILPFDLVNVDIALIHRKNKIDKNEKLSVDKEAHSVTKAALTNRAAELQIQYGNTSLSVCAKGSVQMKVATQNWFPQTTSYCTYGDSSRKSIK